MRLSRINPNRLTEKELERLNKNQKVHTKFFGTIRLATKEDLTLNPEPKQDAKYDNFISIVWL